MDVLKMKLPYIRRRTNFGHTKAINNLRSVDFQQDDITLTLNTDGAPVFKSSNTSLWPILAIINEGNRNKKMMCFCWVYG